MTLFRSADLLMGSACLMPLKGGESVKGPYNKLYPNMCLTKPVASLCCGFA